MTITIEARSKSGTIIRRCETDMPKVRDEMLNKFKRELRVESLSVFSGDLEKSRWTRGVGTIKISSVEAPVAPAEVTVVGDGAPLHNSPPTPVRGQTLLAHGLESEPMARQSRAAAFDDQRAVTKGRKPTKSTPVDGDGQGNGNGIKAKAPAKSKATVTATPNVGRPKSERTRGMVTDEALARKEGVTSEELAELFRLEFGDGKLTTAQTALSKRPKKMGRKTRTEHIDGRGIVHRWV